MKLINTKRVIVRIAIIISLSELMIMLIFIVMPKVANPYLGAILDSLLLLLFATPLIYKLVINPFVYARDEAIDKYNHLAHTDHLTHLANRRLVSIHLVKLIAGCIRHKDYGAVLLIDLDGFKSINDNYGHEAGDAVLVEIAERLRLTLRSEDIIGRMGGDEFIVLIQRLGSDKQIAHNKVQLVAENLIEKFNELIVFNGKELSVGASIGISLLGSNQLDSETAIDEADTAMYSAKKAGKGCAVIFEK